MKLEVGNIHIKDLAFGQTSELLGNKMVINQEELKAFLLELDHRIDSLAFDIAQPGDSTRIMPVKEMIGGIHYWEDFERYPVNRRITQAQK